jgi:hypothetical protein
MADDTNIGKGGGSPGDIFGGGGPSGGQIFGGAILGAGALGLGALFGQGPSPLPPQFGQLTGQEVPLLNQQAGQFQDESASLLAQGAGFTAQGQQALAMAQAGQLTPEQQAAVSLQNQGLTNQARQMYASMGRNPDQDTSFINTTASIDAQTTALSQQYIQSTIALGLGEVGAGTQYSGLAGQFGQLSLSATGQANQALIAAGQAQLQQNQTYNQSLTGMFQALGSLAGPMFKTLLA